MKDKKLIYIAIAVVVIVLAVVIFVASSTNTNNGAAGKTEGSLLEAVLKKNGKTQEEAGYKKFVGGEILSEDTLFSKYAFIVNNSVYIFDPAKLKQGVLSYKKVYDIPSNIKVKKILPNLGGHDIEFIDDKDVRYVIHDENVDNSENDYSSYENANYVLSDYLGGPYTKLHQGETIDYDELSVYWYAKDNILYTYGAKYNNKIEKVSGNYEGEKILKIYNEKLLRTDKGFYEILDYYGENLKGIYTTTMRIKLLSDYYDDVLTFTYEYVVLKDYTLIPINDVMTNRPQKYMYEIYGGLNAPPESFEE